MAAWELCNEPEIGESGGTPHFFKNAEDYNRFYTRTVAGLLRGDPDAKLDMAAYYHIRDCFVDPADFDYS